VSAVLFYTEVLGVLFCTSVRDFFLKVGMTMSVTSIHWNQKSNEIERDGGPVVCINNAPDALSSDFELAEQRTVTTGTQSKQRGSCQDVVQFRSILKKAGNQSTIVQNSTCYFSNRFLHSGNRLAALLPLMTRIL
jgi:hypothetical protein